MTFQLKYSMYNPDPFPSSNKSQAGWYSNYNYECYHPFIYINITTIKKSTVRNELDKSCCTDDSFWGCRWGILYKRSSSFKLESLRHCPCSINCVCVWDQCPLCKVGTAAGTFRAVGDQNWCTEWPAGAVCLASRRTLRTLRPRSGHHRKKHWPIEPTCNFQCRSTAYRSPQRPCSFRSLLNTFIASEFISSWAP